MFDALFITSLIGTVVGLVKEGFETTIPAENWADKKTLQKDIDNGVSPKEQIERAKNGRYKATKDNDKAHRDAFGKVVIENSDLYYDDMMNYDAMLVREWMEQGKYNLTKEELEKQKKEIEESFERLYSYI